MNTIKSYGFVPPKLDAGQKFAGASNSLPKEIIQVDRQWDKYLPKYEPQFNSKYDTNGCVPFGTLNAHEILHKKIYGVEVNDSERYIYNLAEIVPPGSDPHIIADICRLQGMISEELLPMTDDYDEYITPRPMTDRYLSEGKKFTDKYLFQHEWVFTSGVSKAVRVALMKEHLQYSPLGVSVTAWQKDENDLFIDAGRPNTHWCVCYGYGEVDGEVYWKIFDSYDHSLKVLHPDHNIQFCKRYRLTSVPQPIPKVSWWQRIISFIKRLWQTK